MQKAFVTGASGFIGSAVTRRLLEDGIAVRALCRTPAKGQALAAQGAEIIIGDLRDVDSWRQNLNGCDVLFHLGAAMSGSQVDCYTINVNGTLNLVRAAIEANIGRFVHISSIAVYGYDVEGEIDENHPHCPAPTDNYMMTKSAGEAILWTMAKQAGLPAVSIRPAFVYGSGSSLWSRGIYRICSVCTPYIYGGTGYAHPIYVDDVADLIITAATHPAAPGNAFHAAPDPAPTWREFTEYYRRMSGSSLTLEVPVRALQPLGRLLKRGIIGQPLDLNGALRFMGHRATFSMKRAATLLNWHPKIDLEHGMKLTEPWLHHVSR